MHIVSFYALRCVGIASVIGGQEAGRRVSKEVHLSTLSAVQVHISYAENDIYSLRTAVYS